MKLSIEIIPGRTTYDDFKVILEEDYTHRFTHIHHSEKLGNSKYDVYLDNQTNKYYCMNLGGNGNVKHFCQVVNVWPISLKDAEEMRPRLAERGIQLETFMKSICSGEFDDHGETKYTWFCEIPN